MNTLHILSIILFIGGILMLVAGLISAWLTTPVIEWATLAIVLGLFALIAAIIFLCLSEPDSLKQK